MCISSIYWSTAPSNQIQQTSRAALTSPVPNPIKLNPGPVLLADFGVGNFPMSLGMTVFHENGHKACLGACWDRSERALLNGKYIDAASAEAVIGKYYMFANAAVVTRAVGSGGNQGAVGGWVTAGGANEQHLGGDSVGTTVARERIEFTATGSFFGALIGARTDSALALIGVSDSGSDNYYIANGPAIQTITQADIDRGLVGATISLNNGNTISSLGATYVDFRRNNMYYQMPIGIYEDPDGANVSRTISITHMGVNVLVDGTPSTIVVNAFFCASPSQGAVTASNNQATSTSSSGWYVFRWRPICWNLSIDNGATSWPAGYSAAGSAFVQEPVSAQCDAGGAPRFNRQTHADSSQTGQKAETCMVPHDRCQVVGSNASGQAIINVASGAGVKFVQNDWWYIESSVPQLRRVSSVSVDAVTMTANLASTLNANGAAECMRRCETVTSGLSTNTSTVGLASNVYAIKRGDLVAFVANGSAPNVCAGVTSIIGTTLSLDRSVTVGDAVGVLRLCEFGNESYWQVDNVPVWPKPGYIIPSTCSIEYDSRAVTFDWVNYMTAQAATPRGSTTLALNSASNVVLNDELIILECGRQVIKVTNKVGSAVSFSPGLNVQVRSGIYCGAVLSSWNQTTKWDAISVGPVTFIEEKFPKGLGNMSGSYDTMLTAGDMRVLTPKPAVSITNVTQATPTSNIVVTATNHGFSDNKIARIASVGGATQVNADFRTTYVDANHFELQWNSSGVFGISTYTSGGTATEVVMGYSNPFNNIGIISSTGFPTATLNIPIVSPVGTTITGGGTTEGAIQQAWGAASWSDDHEVVQSTWLLDEGVTNRALYLSGAFFQNRAAGDSKTYIGSSLSSDNISIPLTWIKRSVSQRRIDRVPAFSSTIYRRLT